MNRHVTSATVSSQDHWTKKSGDVDLFLFEKYVGKPSDEKGMIRFVHGSSMASQPTFDLRVPGRPDSSVMDWFAKQGYDCCCVDMEGYGRSTKTRDMTSNIADGADDLTAASDYIMKLRGNGPSFTSLQLSVVGMNARQKGWGYYEKLRQNDIMIVQSNQQVSDMIKRGERVIAAGSTRIATRHNSPPRLRRWRNWTRPSRRDALRARVILRRR